MHAFTEKNKLAPSQFSVPLVFDKKWGIIPLYSEYIFLKEKTKTEKKYWPNPKKLSYPFCIETSGNSKVLTVTDPLTKNVLYKSPKFMERVLLSKYNDDEEFRYWFDKAVEISIEQRIKIALFREQPEVEIQNIQHEETMLDDTLANAFETALNTVESLPSENPIITEPPPVFEQQAPAVLPGTNIFPEPEDTEEPVGLNQPTKADFDRFNRENPIEDTGIVSSSGINTIDDPAAGIEVPTYGHDTDVYHKSQEEILATPMPEAINSGDNNVSTETPVQENTIISNEEAVQTTGPSLSDTLNPPQDINLEQVEELPDSINMSFDGGITK